MSIGLALIVIFILYLIDQHNRWQQAVKILGGLIILAVLGVGGFYNWTKYGEYRTAKREAAQQATNQKSIQDCIARNLGAGPRDIFDQVSAQEVCEKDPGTLPPCWSKPALPGGFQIDQNSEKDLNDKRTPPDSKAVCYPIALQSKAPNCKDGLVAGCVDNSPSPWKKYGPTRVYELEGQGTKYRETRP